MGITLWSSDIGMVVKSVKWSLFVDKKYQTLFEQMVIFRSYVQLPEGMTTSCWFQPPWNKSLGIIIESSQVYVETLWNFGSWRIDPQK